MSLFAHAHRRIAIVHHAPHRPGESLWGGWRRESVLAVAHQLRRPATVVTRHYRLAAHERLNGHEPIILVPRWEHHGATARQVVNQSGVIEAADELDAMIELEMAAEFHQAIELGPFAGNNALDAGGDGLRQRPQDQVEALQRRQTRDGK